MDTYSKSLPPDHWLVNLARSHMGRCLIKLKRYREAEEAVADRVRRVEDRARRPARLYPQDRQPPHRTL